MPHGPDHVCAALPKAHLTIDLVFCEAHQAFTARVHAYREDGAELDDLAPPAVIEFGPFDDWGSVVATLTGELLASPLRRH